MLVSTLNLQFLTIIPSIDFLVKLKSEAFMGIPIDLRQTVSFEELLMSQVVQQEALTRLLIEKGVFTKDEFFEMIKLWKEVGIGWIRLKGI